MKQTDLQSDTFKFHLRKMIKAELITKSESGRYSLTAKGKEFTNKIDTQTNTIRQQPKLSVLIVAHASLQGETIYALHKRKRQPFAGYWGFLSGPVLWGESALNAAQRELAKQTQLNGDCLIRGFVRKRDYSEETKIILEDKMFCIITCNIRADSIKDVEWEGGDTTWSHLEYLQNKPHFNEFPIVEALTKNKDNIYLEIDTYHPAAHY